MAVARFIAGTQHFLLEFKMPPCRICHYHVVPEIGNQSGRCVYWNWPILDPDDETENSARGRCLKEAAPQKGHPTGDPYISRLNGLSPIEMAAWHWKLDDYNKNDRRTNIALVISLIAAVLSIASAARSFM